MDDIVIGPDDPRADDVSALLAAHLTFSFEQSPPEHVHALDADGLAAPDVWLFSARSTDGRLLGLGALRQLEDGHAEIKSMHTDAAARGSGVARALLEHLLGVARARGIRRVSLETGTQDGFAAARALYASAGFEPCAPFGDYSESPHSVCMTLPLGDGD